MTRETNLDAWEQPSDYAGFNPIGHYGVIGVNRDSEALDRANWQAACERMAKAAGIDAVPNLADIDNSSILDPMSPDEAPDVYFWEASHWLCGWVRYLMVKPDAPQAVIEEAEAIREDIRQYIVLDDDLLNEMEAEEMEDEDVD